KKGTGQLIGTCGFHLINNNHKRAEIGYELDDTYWGQGYASEALQAILAYGFEMLQLIRIAAVVYVENKSSQKLLIKAGFQEEGLLRK
ncbi:GNAT family N-acetyltransferase, partial [Bacillus cereus]